MASHEIGQGTDRLVLAPAERRDAVLQLMRAAERELVLSVFRCDDFTIIDEVAAAVKRGVQVRVLITQRARGWKERLRDLTALLRSLGVDVRPYEDAAMKYHAKYIVADDSSALVTSLNFTRKCFEETCDFMVFTEDAGVVSSLKLLFETDCTTPSLPTPPMTDRLIVGPQQSRQRVTDLLAAAQETISIVDHRVTDPLVLALLAEKERQGVKIQVLGNGLLGGLICHGRMIVIDGKTAITGSIRLSLPSLDLRREIAIVLEEPTLVAELYDYFQGLAANEANVTKLWSQPTPPEEDDEEDE
jgi:phosphatidylserine/phosphatidylglycerophosphate/cardiolipin synthase-like enzyme